MLLITIILFFYQNKNKSLVINGERPITIIIPSYNNSAWYKKNLDTLFQQKYDNYSVVYIDDCSTDNTAQLVEEYIKISNQSHRVTLIKNKIRKGALHNLYDAIHACEDHTIIITYDGDDWFAHDTVLETINDAYKDNNIWLTYGQYQVYPDKTIGQCRTIPDSVIQSKNYRKYPWVTSHPRTFYAGLFKKIKKEDLLLNGEFFEVTWDQAFMFPMLELANGHIKCIDKVLYIYNQSNPINDFKVRLEKVLLCERIIRNKNVYDSLSIHEATETFLVS